ncbi:hypothetical protein ACTOV4_01275 [Brucella sp. C7-11G]
MTYLIERVSKLAGPDREADARIWCEIHSVVYLDHYPLMHETQVLYKEKGKRKEKVSGDDISHAAFYTSSVDEAIALVRRLWPDMMYRVGNDGEGSDPSLYKGELFIPGEQKDSYFTGVHSVDAIALCIAILRAKEAGTL